MGKSKKHKHSGTKKNPQPHRNAPTVNQTSSQTLSVKQGTTQIPTDFTLNILMLSDWHVGTGAGRVGNIDSLVQRDRTGLPFIPAKTLTGIWRDACELVAKGLDRGIASGIWMQWVNYLFGDQPALEKRAVEVAPREAALSVRSAHFPDLFVKAIAQKKQLIEAITFVKPGISIDPASGCAKEDFLRFEEMVRADAILTSFCQLDLDRLDKNQRNAAFALLVAGAKFIERLGGKRRRGAGRCQWQIDGQNSDTWLDWLEKNLATISEPPQPRQQDALNWSVITSDASSSSWVKVDLTVTTLSPLIIPKRIVGNVVETLDYIPGTHLMSLIIRKLKSLNFDFSNAIAHGNLVVTNATLEIAGTAGKTIPFALFGEKLSGGFAKIEEGGKVYNRFAEQEPSEQLKGEREGYISFQGDGIEYKKITTGIETHNTVNDELQRPTSDIGGVYSYETIPVGTKLRAELRLPENLVVQFSKQDPNWWQKIGGCDRIGQSKKDDYGSVKIEVKSPQNTVIQTEPKNSLLTVWILSDLLLRDERLRPNTSINALQKELEAKLEIGLELREDDDLLSMMARQNRIESWQVRWGLPRPSLVGLAAGSCFVFKLRGAIDTQKLAQLEMIGIGERTAEGFGQLCFNHQLLTQKISKIDEDTPSKSPNNSGMKNKNLALLRSNLQDPSFNYARIIETAAWRSAIQRAALHLASTPESRRQILGIESGKPTMNQLGALRSEIRLLSEPKIKDQAFGVMRWLTHLQSTPNRKEKWNDKSLREIQNLVTNSQLVWDHLKIDDSELTMTQNAQQDLQKELWAEAVQTLVDAIIRAHKRHQEENA